MRGSDKDTEKMQALGEFAALCVFAEGRFHYYKTVLRRAARPGGLYFFQVPIIYNKGKNTNTKVKFAAGI